MLLKAVTMVLSPLCRSPLSGSLILFPLIHTLSEMNAVASC